MHTLPPLRWTRGLPLLALLFVAPALWPDDASGEEVRPARRNQPHAGYAYPAGARVGSTVVINVGGQFLRRVEAVHVSGEGVTGSIVMYLRQPRNLDGPQRRKLLRMIQEARAKKSATTDGDARQRGRNRGGGRNRPRESDEDVELPDSPILKDFESKGLAELREVARYFFRRIPALQRKGSIAETVKVRLVVSPDAEPGVRDLRLQTRQGLTNPIRFRIGLLNEVSEIEPYPATAAAETVVEPPVVVNGQIFPRDADRIRIRAKKGQRLLIRAEARDLVPYQADSVPGWMQATLKLHDPAGNEVAYADEYRYDPDPVLFYEVPADGDYVLLVEDAISRGRDDFVYRITVGELPFVTRVFPLGGRMGKLVNADVRGWNLNWRRVPLDTRPGVSGLREAAWRQGEGITNEVTYSVDDLPELLETEPNDSSEQPMAVELPLVVNGHIGKPGDVDVFSFEGRRGDSVVAEVSARTLGSPVESVVHLVDEKGEVVAWNDDYVPEGLTVRGLGLQTHHSDSYLMAKLPRTGTYFVRLADVRRHGSEDHAYRLRISKPRPDAEVYITPSTINVPAGRAALITVHALRKDGYDGPVTVVLKDAPDGFTLGGGRIPSGQDHVHMTLSGPNKGVGRPLPLEFRAYVERGREKLERRVVPADNVMQAFLWRHIVPAQELAVAVQGTGRGVPIVALAEDDRPVRVPKGRAGKVKFLSRRGLPVKDLRFVALTPPKGVSLGKAKATHDGFTLEVKASRDAERTGAVDNLIVEVFIERSFKDRAGKQQRRRVSLGYLPAIPFRVMRR